MKPERLGYIDALRGLGALSVALFWHYQHFAAPIQPGAPAFMAAPFFGTQPFATLYRHGDLAVDLFFMISGMVFQHVYGRAADQGRVISARHFWWHRVARLYPLHLLGLCLAAALAWSFHTAFGRFPIYHANGVRDALANLLFLQGLEPQRWWLFSFDGPSWSLSVEALLYLLFYVSLRLRRPALLALLFAGTGLLFWLPTPLHGRLLNDAVPQGLATFFLGVIILRATERRRPITWLLLPAYAAGMALYCVLAHRIMVARGLAMNLSYATAWAVFGTALIALRLLPCLARSLECRPLLWLGDRSLAIYLLHVPVQMMLLGLFAARGQAVPLASPAFWLIYAALVIMLADAVHRGFEVPARRFVRLRSRS